MHDKETALVQDVIPWLDLQRGRVIRSTLQGLKSTWSNVMEMTYGEGWEHIGVETARVENAWAQAVENNESLSDATKATYKSRIEKIFEWWDNGVPMPFPNHMLPVQGSGTIETKVIELDGGTRVKITIEIG